jgi:hypothetical protein
LKEILDRMPPFVHLRAVGSRIEAPFPCGITGSMPLLFNMSRNGSAS